MTATLDDVAKRKPAEVTAEQQGAIELVRLAKEQGLSLTGPDGLLKQLTKSVIETALDEEMAEHLGYAKHDRAGIGAENIRNGTRSNSPITGRVVEEMQAWQARPLDEVYAAIFIDAVVVKIRDGQVANRPIYAAIGVSLDSERDILGL